MAMKIGGETIPEEPAGLPQRREPGPMPNRRCKGRCSLPAADVEELMVLAGRGREAEAISDRLATTEKGRARRQAANDDGMLAA